MEVIPARRAAIISNHGNVATQHFSSALKAHLDRHADAESNITVYEAETRAGLSPASFEEQVRVLRVTELAILAGNRTIVIPALAWHQVAAALRPAVLARVVDTASAVLEWLITSADPISRVALICVTAPPDFDALVKRFADAGIGLSAVPLGYADAGLLAKSALQASHSGAERLWLADELWHLADDLPAMAPPRIDVVQACVRQMLGEPACKPFKLGVVGGVGPAATVAFLDHVVQATPARCDQEHIRIVVEQNPQIPDRTAHLLRKEADPTLALLSTCERLQRAGATAIAIPCNTAHAFVKRIESLIDVPIVHMLSETLAFVVREVPDAHKIGLLATDGTIDSGLYHQQARAAGLDLLVPWAPHQQEVMTAIYGPRGVKAGHRDARQRQALQRAIGHLASRGARAVILGCTELPLLIAQNLRFECDGRVLAVIDPSSVLALRCVALSVEASSASYPSNTTRATGSAGRVAEAVFQYIP